MPYVCGARQRKATATRADGEADRELETNGVPLVQPEWILNELPVSISGCGGSNVALWILADAVGTLAFAAVCLMPAPNVQLSTERK